MNESVQAAAGPDLLVVDDEDRNRTLLEQYLIQAGYRVRTASSGSEALEQAFRQPPDLVLLDIMMPDINGLEVCRKLKAGESTRMTQVMMVTALGGTPNRVEGLDCGADDYVTKPVRREEFLAKVRSLLRVRSLLLELEEAREELRAHNAELEELQAFKETLAQTLVHDLKNPLTAILGTLEIMEKRSSGSERERLTRCRSYATRMSRMIMDILDVSGLEERRLKLEESEVDALELVRHARRGLEYVSDRRTVSFEIAEPGDPVGVRGDGKVLQRIVDNILVNAVEHSPAGGRIRVSVSRREEGVEISVTDQGSGIPEDCREKIFEKYGRLDLSKSGVSANRGLGLTFCRLAVEAHGGVIWVEDGEEGGARFRMILPATEAQGESGDRLAVSA